MLKVYEVCCSTDGVLADQLLMQLIGDSDEKEENKASIIF